MWVVLLLHVSGDDAHEDVAHLTNNSRCGRKQLILKYLLSLIPTEKIAPITQRSCSQVPSAALNISISIFFSLF